MIVELLKSILKFTESGIRKSSGNIAYNRKLLKIWVKLLKNTYQDNCFHISGRWVNMKKWIKVFFVSRTTTTKISTVPMCNVQIEYKQICVTYFFFFFWHVIIFLLLHENKDCSMPAKKVDIAQKMYFMSTRWCYTEKNFELKTVINFFRNGAPYLVADSALRLKCSSVD